MQALFFYTMLWDVWEARFWNLPWTDAVPEGTGHRTTKFSGQPCPFTGKNAGLPKPVLRCSITQLKIAFERCQIVLLAQARTVRTSFRLQTIFDNPYICCFFCHTDELCMCYCICHTFECKPHFKSTNGGCYIVHTRHRKGGRCAAGLQPTMRCSSCKAAVHESAFNYIEDKTTFVVGESVLRWDLATAATEKLSTPAIARVEVRPCRIPNLHTRH